MWPAASVKKQLQLVERVDCDAQRHLIRLTESKRQPAARANASRVTSTCDVRRLLNGHGEREPGHFRPAAGSAARVRNDRPAPIMRPGRRLLQSWRCRQKMAPAPSSAHRLVDFHLFIVEWFTRSVISVRL